jgi:DNA-binding NarL/FixJ family response regulator
MHTLIRMKKGAEIALLPSKHTTIVLAEDHAPLRKVLKILIETDSQTKVVGEAGDGHEAIRLTLSLRPEVVIMDIGMPLFNGLQATRQIMDAVPATRVIMLSAHWEPAYIEQAMISGASAYLIKQYSTELLGQAIREVLAGHTYFCPSIAKGVRNRCQRLFGKCEGLKKKQKL